MQIAEGLGDTELGLALVVLGQQDAEIVVAHIGREIVADDAFDALAERAPPRRLWLSAEVTEQGVNLVLRDNGPGFSEQALRHAREPFFTTKTSTQGLGLGLAICETLMRALGGELLLANHAQGGAQVTLQLRGTSADASLQPPEEFS